MYLRRIPSRAARYTLVHKGTLSAKEQVNIVRTERLIDMKKVCLIVIVFVLGGVDVLGQSREVIRVRDNGTSSSLPARYKYQFEQFGKGTVHYWNGKAATARLNYNLLLREMQFLSPTGDTLTLDQEQTIRKVEVNDAVFVYDPKAGFLKIMGEYGSTRLALSQSLQVAGVDKQGGYGQSSGVSSIKTYSSISNSNSSISPLEIKGDVVYSHKQTFFLVDQNNLVYPVSRRTILKIYSKHKSAVETYLHEQTIRFNEPEDLQRLLEFCKVLPN